MPHTKAMKQGLYELRLKGKEGIARAFFATVLKNEIRISHVFIKEIHKTPAKELDIAHKRLEEVKQDV